MNAYFLNNKTETLVEIEYNKGVQEESEQFFFLQLENADKLLSVNVLGNLLIPPPSSFNYVNFKLI